MDCTENEACQLIAISRPQLYVLETVPLEPALPALFRRPSSYVVRAKIH